MKQTLLFAIIVMAAAAAATCPLAIPPTAAGQLSKETTPSPSPPGSTPGAIVDDQDLDLAIDPDDPLPANGTVQMSTAGATDVDMNIFPPVGVTVIIQNETVTVTNQSITFGTPTPVDTSSSGDEGGGSDEDEE